MAGKHIFAKDIRSQLETGQTRLELPTGSKLSPQAADMIKDYGAEVVFVDPNATPPPPAKAAPAAPPAPEQEAVRQAVEQSGPAGRISEDQVEEILNRVLAKLAEAKDRPAPQPASQSTTLSPGADDDLIICRCEEITKGEIRAVIAAGMSTLNGVKRITRAGMGLCQGQTCQRLVTQILCSELGLSPAEVEPTTARPPTRPIPLDVLATG